MRRNRDVRVSVGVLVSNRGVGGVYRSAEGLVEALEEVGLSARLVVAREFSQAIRGLWALASTRGAAILLYNFSTWRRLRVGALAAILFRVPIRRQIAYLHGSDFVRSQPPRIGKRLLLSFDEIWVTNAQIADRLHALGVACRIASPSVAAGAVLAPIGKKRDGSRLRVVAAQYGGDSDLYGTHAVLELAERSRPKVDVTIVAYGPQGVHRDWLREQCSRRNVRLLEDLEEARVRELLARSDVLLRLTLADGDSLLVREALACGCRVIASDVVPRPFGVELVGLPVRPDEAWLRRSHPLSNGAGLSSTSVVDDVVRLAGELRSGERAASA